MDSMFTVQGMILRLDNGNIVEINLNNTSSPIVSSTMPLTDEEHSLICFHAGVFWGAGQKALKEIKETN